MRTGIFFVTVVGATLFAALFSSAAGAREAKDRHWERVEMLRIWKLTEVLELDEEAMARIAPVVKTYNKKMRHGAMEREKTLHQLRRACRKEEGVDEKLIRESTRKILSLESEMMKTRHAHYKEMEKRLDPRLMGRYLLFEVRFQDEIQKFMQDMRGGKHRKGRFRRGRGNKEESPPEVPLGE